MATTRAAGEPGAARRVRRRPPAPGERGARRHAVMGSQLASTFQARRYDGVVGVWYGKSPGVDRAGDAIRHAQFAGTAPLGGVLALVGDDPACKSSTLPSRSEPLLAALGLPVLYPGTMQDVIDLCRHGVELSRACGLWVAMKVVAASPTGRACGGRSRPHPPGRSSSSTDGHPWPPAVTGNIGPVERDPQRGRGPRHPHRDGAAVPRDQRAEPDRRRRADPVAGHRRRLATSPSRCWRRFGELGLDARRGRTRHPVPQARRGPSAGRGGHPPAGQGVRTVLVVEDKQPFLETWCGRAVWHGVGPPAVIGKRDAVGAPLVPLAGA